MLSKLCEGLKSIGCPYLKNKALEIMWIYKNCVKSDLKGEKDSLFT